MEVRAKLTVIEGLINDLPKYARLAVILTPLFEKVVSDVFE